MSTRSRDAARLAQLLTEETGVPVTVNWQGAGSGLYAGWHVNWSGGPSEVAMRGIVAQVGSVVPAVVCR